MTRRLRLPATPPRGWLPRRSVRLRLTLLYGAVFVVSSAGLLAIPYALVANTASNVRVLGSRQVPPGAPPAGSTGQVTVAGPTITEAGTGASAAAATFFVQVGGGRRLPAIAANVQRGIDAERASVRTQLLVDAGFALAGMAVVSMGLGWLLAGRALRPVRTMTVRARRISERNLHERLAVNGPDDELKELADTFDGLLARLERAFEAQRHFVANASHELRTPLTLQRAAAEVALADPDASVTELRETLARVVGSAIAQERLLEALLTLARGQRGLDRREPVDLADIAAEAIAGVAAGPVQIHSALGGARASGDRRLLERLVANLLDNAARYNLDGGWVLVRTATEHGRALLTVTNSGPHIAAHDVPRLLEPFIRGPGQRAEHGQGLGLGLSIVAAIVDAHGGSLRALARTDGGLEVDVELEAAVTKLAPAAALMPAVGRPAPAGA